MIGAIYRTEGHGAAKLAVQQGLTRFPASANLHFVWAEMNLLEGHDLPNDLDSLVDEDSANCLRAIEKWDNGDVSASELILNRMTALVDEGLRRKIVERLLRQFMTGKALFKAERLVNAELERGSSWFGHWLMATLLVSAKRPRSALDSVLRAREDPRGLGNLFVDDVEWVARYKLREYRRCVELLEPILLNWPRDFGNWYWLARSRAKLGLYESAEEALRRSLAVQTDLRGLRRMVLLQARQGHFREAKQSFNLFMTFDR